MNLTNFLLYDGILNRINGNITYKLRGFDERKRTYHECKVGTYNVICRVNIGTQLLGLLKNRVLNRLVGCYTGRLRITRLFNTSVVWGHLSLK